MSYNGTFWAIQQNFLQELLYSNKSDSLFTADYAAAIPESSNIFLGSRINDVAIISLTGLIDRNKQLQFKSELMTALEDDSISSIVAYISSGGGMVHGTKELSDYIYSVRDKKPMLAYADGLCASAALWIASAFGKIYASATTSLGSIGVISVIPNYSALNQKWGIEYTYLQSGKWKSVGNSDNPLKEEEKEYLQTRINQINDYFQADITRNLALSGDSSGWNEAQIFLAKEAKEMGFIVEIVQDLAQSCNIIKNSKEEYMDLKTLKAKFPELYKAVYEEGKESAKTEAGDSNAQNLQAEKTEDAQNLANTSHAEEQSQAKSPIFELIGSFLTAEQKADITQIAQLAKNAGISFEQASQVIQGYKSNSPQGNTTDVKSEEKNSIEAQLLSALENSSKAINVNQKIEHSSKSALVTNAEKRVL